MAIDVNIQLRAAAAGNLTETANGSAVDFGGPDLVKQTYQVDVPSASGTTPTLDIKIQESDDGTTFRDYLAFPQITAAGQYHVTGKSNARYRRFAATLGGTNPNFGAVQISPVPGGRYTNW